MGLQNTRGTVFCIRRLMLAVYAGEEGGGGLFGDFSVVADSANGSLSLIFSAFAAFGWDTIG